MGVLEDCYRLQLKKSPGVGTWPSSLNLPQKCILPRLQKQCTRLVKVDCTSGRRGFPRPSVQEHARQERELRAILLEAEAPSQRLGLFDEINGLQELLSSLASFPEYPAKLKYLLDATSLRAYRPFFSGLPPREAYPLACLVLIGQAHILESCPESKIRELSLALVAVEEFYDSIGGLIGYQLQCLKLIVERAGQASSTELETEPLQQLLVPSGLDLCCPTHASKAQKAVAQGLAAVPFMAEIYPLGGAGDRLGLQCEDTGNALPTAMLDYCGKSLLEWLIRDLQAREYLYYKVYGTQSTTPVAVMTSAAKGNHWRVEQLFEEANWFGRGKDAFRLFQQPLVPVVGGTDGKWLLCNNNMPHMKPGGHGVIWKLMRDKGIFSWLAETHKRSAGIIRQISNPMAGTDTTLLALAGVGVSRSRSFGFASCERVVGAAEGMNVLIKRDNKACVSNVEYTEFARLGITDVPRDEGGNHSVFPANTNVLYVGLSAVEAAVETSVKAGSTDAILPGMILNLSKEVAHKDPQGSGAVLRTKAGRLECTMQNMADCFAERVSVDSESDLEQLQTFLVYNRRRKVTSSAKRQLAPGSTKVHQTPHGSFYDLQANGGELLEVCGMDVPQLGTVEEYLTSGPGYIFLFHPALGPLWSVIAQKIQGGRLGSRSELRVEAAEVCLVDLDVEGSLLIEATNPLGHTERCGEGSEVLTFSDRCGRVKMERVKVRNAGIDWQHPENIYWKGRLTRHESCRIILHGRAEFEAVDVELAGNGLYEVPDGYKMRIETGGVQQVEPLPGQERPSWEWEYKSIEEEEGGGGRIELRMV